MSSSSEKKTPGALAGKSSRPCDSCIFRRAKWYCAADDAFLCQICDASVHSANLLSRRHHRLRLKVAAHKESIEPVNDVVEISPPPWNLGFRRKARTPRHTKPLKVFQNPLIVPEINSDEVFPEENEAQVLYQVPIFDPVMESKELSLFPMYQCGYANLNDSLPTELNMTEFSVNMENLLGRGLDEDSFCMSLLDHKEEDDMSCNVRVKVEQGEERQEYLHMMEKKENNASVLVHFTEEKKRILLKLDYEAVLAAWEKKDSPWMTGDRPQLDPDESWPDLMSNCSSQSQTYREMTVLGGNMTPLNGGREARVSRYREKRRTRAFAKKIRYEVRKLNAEKRPRMKGRFVKRTSFVSEQKHHWINAIGV